MKERKITKHLKDWLEGRGWMVYKPPDTYGSKVECPICHSELYCQTCASRVDKDENSRFTPYKPADLCVMQSPMMWGGWIEVKTSHAKTEKGMNYKPGRVKEHQAKAMAKTNGFLAVAFIQKLNDKKEKLIGLYLVEWKSICEKEVVTRDEFRDLAKVTVKDDPLIEQEKPEKKQSAVAEYLDG